LTLAPLHSHLVRGIEGKPGSLPKTCSVPGCLRVTRDRHHIWSKSYLRGQPVEWIELPWGEVVQNTTGLCVEHHAMVTGEIGGHKAAIMIEGQTFMWAERNMSGKWIVQGPLIPQPTSGATVVPHAKLAEGEACPTCGYVKPRKSEPGPKRAAKSWMVLVPDDAELGAEVLDNWVDDFAVLFGFGDTSSRLKRYHVLAMILAWADQHRVMLIEDIIESHRR
jgi:hypothetical protein